MPDSLPSRSGGFAPTGRARPRTTHGRFARSNHVTSRGGGRGPAVLPPLRAGVGVPPRPSRPGRRGRRRLPLPRQPRNTPPWLPPAWPRTHAGCRPCRRGRRRAAAAAPWRSQHCAPGWPRPAAGRARLRGPCRTRWAAARRGRRQAAGARPPAALAAPLWAPAAGAAALPGARGRAVAVEPEPPAAGAEPQRERARRA